MLQQDYFVDIRENTIKTMLLSEHLFFVENEISTCKIGFYIYSVRSMRK